MTSSVGGTGSSPARPPAPCIGLRRALRVHGEPYLHGIVDREFVVQKGSRVQLRRLRPEDTAEGPAFAIVFAPPDPRLKASDLEQARRDATWFRNDPRDVGGEVMP